LLAHLYVLIPVLDDEKHYYVGEEEIEKLLRYGEGWLKHHPELELITRRYLRHRRVLMRVALEQLVAEETPDAEETIAQQASIEAAGEEKINLHQLRLQSVLDTLVACGARRVLDLGCGEGKLLALLLRERQFETILGMDVSHRALEIAGERLHLEQMPPKQRERISLIQGSLLYRDPRLSGYEAAAVVEVIEHLDPPRLAAFERVLFEAARPVTIALTTPNVEYNRMWPTLPAGHLRHGDHRFEWSRAEFAAWAQGVAARFGYRVRFAPIGPEEFSVGAPSQMAIFELEA
jgi:3' terminal RNA ribose 2'-O-methyltransferase Hen1